MDVKNRIIQTYFDALKDNPQIPNKTFVLLKEKWEQNEIPTEEFILRAIECGVDNDTEN